MGTFLFNFYLFNKILPGTSFTVTAELVNFDGWIMGVVDRLFDVAVKYRIVYTLKWYLICITQN